MTTLLLSLLRGVHVCDSLYQKMTSHGATTYCPLTAVVARGFRRSLAGLLGRPATCRRSVWPHTCPAVCHSPLELAGVLAVPLSVLFEPSASSSSAFASAP